KGAFDAIEGVALANQQLAAKKSPLRFRLTLIGAFASATEEKELRGLIQQRGLQFAVDCLGFVSAERKEAALRDADLFCFPTYYSAENQPGNLIEALAFGVPIVTTRWRSVPEMLPPGYSGVVDPKSPAQIADALQRLVVMDLAGPLRSTFQSRFTIERHLAGMAEALRSVE
ncbi:MAG TPA: glycosyltransferase family 4 protein, partial [Verrucomicrobiae bacterium]|nr:glycosyltransferase family 4 protein [Verrucomicrobiae bacterium]